MEGKRTLRAFALLSWGVSALGAYMAHDVRNGLPDYDDLEFTEGRMLSAKKTKYDIDIEIENSEMMFSYISKVNKMSTVWDSLYLGALVTVGHEPLENNRSTVFEISVDGKMIRSYAEIEEAWVEDNKVGRILFVVFLLSGAYLWWVSNDPENRASS